MNYQQKQVQLFDHIEKSFKEGQTPSTIVEPVENYADDDRICLTSVVFIPPKIQETIISEVINPLRQVDLKQYYYVPNSFHITIQNIRTINNPFFFNQEDIEKAKEVFRKVIPKHKSFSFKLKGLFELPTSLSIKAFSDESFHYLVKELRETLTTAGVSDNKKYASKDVFFGNSNICRYTSKPNSSFFEKVTELKDHEIGEIKVNDVSLITTNSVCYPNKTKIIQKYNLKRK